ncbi:MAG TPA: hypothetical protein VIP46_07805 [Pyrinomonadaceae bacterium]
MSWMDQIGNMLQQYAGANAQAAPDNVQDDFDQLARNAPPSAVADGLAAAFRSEETPPFPSMVSQLFDRSDGQQRAGILNTLIRTLGPTVVAQILARRAGGGAAGGGGLGDLLGGLLGGGQPTVTPDVAQQIPPDAVEEIAQRAEQQDPSIVDMISGFYARNPQLVKTLGAAALTIALAKIAQSRQGG